MMGSRFILAIVLPTVLALVASAQQPAVTTTTTTQAPVPTPAPIPSNHSQCFTTTTKPNPEVKKFNYNNCTLVQLASYITIGANQYLNLKDGLVNESMSKCNDSTTNLNSSKLVLDFDCGQLNIEIKSDINHSVYVALISGQYYLNGTAAGIAFSNSTPSFNTTATGRYYKCNAEQNIDIGQGKTLHLSKLAIEAFRTVSGSDFYKVVDECPLDSAPVSDLVRIGVGVCLVALVAIVIVAYFIGRRRWSERSSYESV